MHAVELCPIHPYGRHILLACYSINVHTSTHYLLDSISIQWPWETDFSLISEYPDLEGWCIFTTYANPHECWLPESEIALWTRVLTPLQLPTIVPAATGRGRYHSNYTASVTSCFGHDSAAWQGLWFLCCPTVMLLLLTNSRCGGTWLVYVGPRSRW